MKVVKLTLAAGLVFGVSAQPVSAARPLNNLFYAVCYTGEAAYALGLQNADNVQFAFYDRKGPIDPSFTDYSVDGLGYYQASTPKGAISVNVFQYTSRGVYLGGRSASCNPR